MPKKKPSQARIKIAWKRISMARRSHKVGYPRVHGLHKLGLISYRDFCIVSDDMHKLRWGHRGIGRWWKRRLSKARRREWKTRKGNVNIESECNWKGH